MNKSIFPLIGLIMALPFIILNLIYVSVAMLSGTDYTIIYWDYFGEIIPELILFSFSFTIIMISLVITFINYRREKR